MNRVHVLMGWDLKIPPKTLKNQSFFKSNLVKEKFKEKAPNYWKLCSGADQWFDQTHLICETGHIIDNPGSSRSIPEYYCDTKLSRQEEK